MDVTCNKQKTKILLYDYKLAWIIQYLINKAISVGTIPIAFRYNASRSLGTIICCPCIGLTSLKSRDSYSGRVYAWHNEHEVLSSSFICYWFLIGSRLLWLPIPQSNPQSII